jgi:hypothetical protein
MLVHNGPNLLILLIEFHAGNQIEELDCDLQASQQSFMEIGGAIEIESHHADRFSGGGVSLCSVAEAMLCAFFAGTTPEP